MLTRYCGWQKFRFLFTNTHKLGCQECSAVQQCSYTGCSATHEGRNTGGVGQHNRRGAVRCQGCNALGDCGAMWVGQNRRRCAVGAKGQWWGTAVRWEWRTLGASAGEHSAVGVLLNRQTNTDATFVATLSLSRLCVATCVAIFRLRVRQNCTKTGETSCQQAEPASHSSLRG